MRVVNGEPTDACEVCGGQLIVAFFYKKSRRLIVEEGEQEDDTSEDEMDRSWGSL